MVMVMEITRMSHHETKWVMGPGLHSRIDGVVEFLCELMSREILHHLLCFR